MWVRVPLSVQNLVDKSFIIQYIYISILDINKFKDLLKEGFSIKEIQKIMNVGKTTLYRFRKENNLFS